MNTSVKERLAPHVWRTLHHEDMVFYAVTIIENLLQTGRHRKNNLFEHLDTLKGSVTIWMNSQIRLPSTGCSFKILFQTCFPGLAKFGEPYMGMLKIERPGSETASIRHLHRYMGEEYKIKRIWEVRRGTMALIAKVTIKRGPDQILRTPMIHRTLRSRISK